MTWSRSVQTWSLRRNFAAELFIDTRFAFQNNHLRTPPSIRAMFRDAFSDRVTEKLVSTIKEIVGVP